MNIFLKILPIQFAILFFLPSTLFSQETITDSYPREKVYLHTDRTEYGAGEIIHYKAYLTEDNISEETVLSKVLYVELIDLNNTKVAFQQIKLADGKGIGTIDINRKLTTGSYTLRAYTSYMRNFEESIFYRQQLMIIGTDGAEKNNHLENSVQVSFYPEGGDLMIGVPQIVAINALVNGVAAALKGTIKDHTGKSIATVTTNEFGLGKFKVIPQENTSYYFESEDYNIQLPDPVSMTQSLKVVTSVNHIIVKVNGNMDLASTVIAISQGALIWSAPVQSIGFKLPKSDLPKGLITFAIVADNGQPLAERLAFNHKGINDYNVEISLPEEGVSSRELVDAQIEVYDDNGDPLAAELSMSVVDNRFHATGLDIASQLYLQSEVKGIIMDPQQYLTENTQEVINKTDLLLLTQGWRRYNWTDPKEVLYPKEKGLSISGRTVKPNNLEQPMKAYGSMSVLSTEFAIFPIETGEDGYFFINDVDLSDSTTLFFQISTKKKKGKNVEGASSLKGKRKIEVLLDNPLVHQIGRHDSLWLSKKVKATEKPLKNDLFQVDEQLADDEWYIDESLLLSEITIKEKRFDKWVNYYDEEITYTQPNNRLFTDNIGAIEGYIDIYDVLRGRVPGIEIVGSLDGLSKKSVIIRGRSTGLSASTQSNNAAKFILNGSIVSALTAESIRPADIAFIDVLKSLSQVAQYGELGGGGLIAIYLKPPGSRSRVSEKQTDKGLYVSYQGFASAKEFFVADYSDNAYFQKNETRRTVHWDPSIIVNADGEGESPFYTSDYLGTYHINIQGLTSEGLPVSYQTKLIVE